MEGICNEREVGNYQHPSDCNKYVACTACQDPIVMSCPEKNLRFNRLLNQCVEPERAHCLVPLSETSFGAKDNKFGQVDLSRLPKGVITQVKLEHVSGFVKCSTGSTNSKWGCNNKPPYKYTESVSSIDISVVYC